MKEQILLSERPAVKRWEPVAGEQAINLLLNKGFSDGKNELSPPGVQILEESLRVLQSCGNPEAEGSDTGLVTGYVQSGKTLNYTALAALAHDNHYQLVIVIAGSSLNHFHQSTKRLYEDLKVGIGKRVWAPVKNPVGALGRNAVATVLQQWANPTIARDRCRSLLITVMKHSEYLRNLAELLEHFDLTDVPALIIDDECEQAGLHTSNRKISQQDTDPAELPQESISSTYRRIVALRATLPRHSFLLYTSMPQANLFINIMDRLSPNYIRLLAPGNEYTGGIQFFRHYLHLVEVLPDDHVPSKENLLDSPPESLLYALRIYYVGVAVGEMDGGNGNRSMLVHPLRLQEEHNKYFDWVIRVKESWLRLMSSSNDGQCSILLDEFRAAHTSLLETVGSDLPSFERILEENALQRAIESTQILEAGTRAGNTAFINWQDFYSHIIVGGPALDRGFRIEGLTVTYMPRNTLRSSNADMVQQRARFFGCKRNYLGYCRLFLDPKAIEACQAMVDHEENVKACLIDFDIKDRALNEWDRSVMLRSMLNLTRDHILFDVVYRSGFGNEWIRMRAPHDTPALVNANLQAIDKFLAPRIKAFSVSAGHPERSAEQKHLYARLRLQDCLDNLLNELRFTEEQDSAQYSMLRGMLQSRLVTDPGETCVVYLMSAQSLDKWTIRERTLRKYNIEQLFMGRNPAAPKPAVYPGDAEVKEPKALTIQVHRVSLRATSFTDVATLAVWVPAGLGDE